MPGAGRLSTGMRRTRAQSSRRADLPGAHRIEQCRDARAALLTRGVVHAAAGQRVAAPARAALAVRGREEHVELLLAQIGHLEAGYLLHPLVLFGAIRADLGVDAIVGNGRLPMR